MIPQGYAPALPPFDQLPANYYRTFAVDPPWWWAGGKKGRPQHYRRMRDAEIAALPIAQLAHPEGAWFFVWVTGPKLLDAGRVVLQWYRTKPNGRREYVRYSGMGFEWIKTHKRLGAQPRPLFFHRSSFHIGQGFTTRKNAEYALLFKIGRPARSRKDVEALIIEPLREHSRKPEQFFERCQLFAPGPYCDVFSREPRPDWSQFGDEITRFAA